jgi:hypothetical protein
MSVPYQQLDISSSLQTRLEGDPPVSVRLALAAGAMCSSDKERLGLCVLLSADPDERVSASAKRTLSSWNGERIRGALHRQTHEKILEYIVEFLSQAPKTDEEIFRCVNINPRTAKLVTRRANARNCEEIARSTQQLLLNPSLLFELQSNEECPGPALHRAESFLRMQKALPSGYTIGGSRPAPPAASSAPAAPASAASSQVAMDLEAEIMASLSGSQSPSLLKAQESIGMFDIDAVDTDDSGLDDFSFDFKDQSADVFSFDLSGQEQVQSGEEEEVRLSIEQQIANMTVGHKIKLAFGGNKEARGILIRDRNRSVATAVVKSGRLTDGEVAAFAANRNLSDDVIREITTVGDYTRRYPVKVALVNNPKTPVGIAIGMISSLQKRDLQALTRNRNVSGVISKAANKRYKEKFRKS